MQWFRDQTWDLDRIEGSAQEAKYFVRFAMATVAGFADAFIRHHGDLDKIWDWLGK